MTQTNNDIEELEELLTELEGQEAQLVSPYSEDDDAVTQLMDAPLGDQEWMVQVTALDRRMMSTDALLAELQSGRLSNKTLVWRGGMDDWLPISRIDALAQASLAAPAAAPRMAVGSLPPPPAPLPAPPAWASLPSVPLASPPPNMPSPAAVAPTMGLGPNSMGAPSAGLPPPAPSSNLDLPRPVVVPLPPPPSDISLGNTTRPVAVDFDDIPVQSASPLRGKRALMGFSAVAILALFVTVYAFASKSDGTMSAEASSTKSQPQAAAAQPMAAPERSAPERSAPEHRAEATPPAPPKAAEPKPEPADSKPSAAVAMNEEAAPSGSSASRATTAPARYSVRSEYRRRSRPASAAERAEAESESRSQVSSRAVPARASAPAEEAPAATEVASTAAADDDADVAEAPKSTSKSANTFNRDAAKAALEDAAQQARNCRPAGGPSGTGRVQVRYEPSGKVANVSILTSKFENTTTGSCVRMLFRRAKVPEFTGAPVVVVNKSFEIP